MSAKKALQVLNETDINLCYSTRKLQRVKKNDYYYSIRTKGGVDGYCHYKGALKKVVPWIQDLNRKGIHIF
jgi:hypothetical protein